MGHFPTHREVHTAPAGYRVWRRVTLPAAGDTIDIRDPAWLNCPWLGGTVPGSHTQAMALQSAVLKAVAVFLPNTVGDDNFRVGDDAAGFPNAPGDRGGLLHVVWPSAGARHAFHWQSTAGDLAVQVELWFDVPVDPEG